MESLGRLPLDHHHREQMSNSVVTFFSGRGQGGLDLRTPPAPRETDLKTVVRKLREDSDLFSQTLDALPNPNRADASQPRKKRWAARVKTGCVTCRSRRIKCDEAKPACKRCALTGRTCTYEAAATSTSSISSPEMTSSSSCSSSSPEPPPLPVKGLPSPDWHVTESLQYYITVMLPMHGFHATGDSAYVSSYQTQKMMRDDGFDSASFVMQILSHRVQCMSSAHRIPNVYGALPAIKPVWERLFHQMAIAVSNLNRCMALERNIYFVLHRVVDLMHTELTLSIPTWRAHAEGFGALVKTYGGIPTLFRLQKPPAMSAQLALIASTMCNSTSPADQQIKLMSNWSDGDIATAYSHTGFHAFPCPTVLLQAICRITHLRTLVSGCTDAEVVNELVPMAREAFAKIQHFDPDSWIEPYATDHEFFPVVGRAFQYAVALYGILSLPGPLAAVFTYPPQAATPAHEARQADDVDDLISEITQKYPTTRIRYREHLYTLFQRALPAAPSVEGLLWHAAVLGVAYSNHEEEEHRVILDYVAGLRFVYGADGGAIHLYDKLRAFWVSGKKEWDQCFHEPTNILT